MSERQSANIDGAPAGPVPDGAGRAEEPPLRLAAADLDLMAASAARAADFLKSLSHEQRLMILCHLASGERSVGEIEALLGARQAAVSQQLARLRHEGLVTARREGRTIRYALADGRSSRLIGLLHEMFCQAD